MDIKNFFKDIILTPQQEDAINHIINFINSDFKIFILRGYAGSGKTTLIKGVIELLKNTGKSFQLMAPTGRAAKILRSKTSHNATTIHKGIYSFEKLEVITENNSETNDIHLKYIFPLKVENNSTSILHNHICLIDESSMISNQTSNNDLFRFGSDNLLKDLLSYALKGENNKIIFIGDPAQLPPVTDNISCALDPEYFKGVNIPTQMYELTGVIRQKEESNILSFAGDIRKLLSINPKERNELKLIPDDKEIFIRDPQTLVSEYQNSNPELSLHESAIICYSNATAWNYNQAIRSTYGFSSDYPEKGELLMIIQNNYSNPDHELFNGDIIKIIQTSSSEEVLHTPVFIRCGTEKKSVTISLHFRTITFTHESGSVLKMKIICNLLHNNRTSLSLEEIKALYINFKIRYPKLKENTPEFHQMLKDDPYFNAIRVKFAYAITCHKAQGGEWNTTYIDYSGRIGLNNDCLRWIYTATTRSKEKLYASSIPNLSPLRKLSFAPIGRISKTPADALVFREIASTPWHPESSHACKRDKYFHISDILSGTPYTIKKIKSNPYQEEYYIVSGEAEYRFDAIHDGAGFFKPFSSKSTTPEALEIQFLLNNSSHKASLCKYVPSAKSFDQLYQYILNAINDTEIYITNIKESPENYYITYYFKTSGNYSSVQFYFDGSKTITRALPKSDLGENDNLMNLLIKKLS